MAHKLVNTFAAFFNFLARTLDTSDLYDEEGTFDEEMLNYQLERDTALYTLWMY